MTTNTNSIEPWLNAITESVGEMASSCMQMEAGPAKILTQRTPLPEDYAGSFISITNDSSSVQLGLTSNAEGLQCLAKAILNMSSVSTPLPEADIADAVSEIANIIAGGVKRRMSNPENPLRLGLPIYVQKPTEQGGSLESAGAIMNIGSVETRIVVFKKRKD